MCAGFFHDFPTTMASIWFHSLIYILLVMIFILIMKIEEGKDIVWLSVYLSTYIRNEDFTK